MMLIYFINRRETDASVFVAYKGRVQQQIVGATSGVMRVASLVPFQVL